MSWLARRAADGNVYRGVAVVDANVLGKTRVCIPLNDPISGVTMAVQVVDGQPCLVANISHATNRDVHPPSSATFAQVVASSASGSVRPLLTEPSVAGSVGRGRALPVRE